MAVHDTKQKGFWMHQGKIAGDSISFMRYYDNNSNFVRTNDLDKASSLELNIYYNFTSDSKCYASNEYWVAMHPNLIDSGSEVKIASSTNQPQQNEPNQTNKPNQDEPQQEDQPIQDEPQQEDQTSTDDPEQEEDWVMIGSGTGFYVNNNGYVVTNEHVAGICEFMISTIDGENQLFKVLALDKNNDLALLRSEYKNENYLNIDIFGAEYGEDIMAFGYPLSNILSSSVKLTRGIVSSLSGPGNNIAEIQIDAALQRGNSGGPVLNYDGQVVGVVSWGLDKVKMLLNEEDPDIPENVNFAVAAQTLVSFLKSNQVTISNESYDIKNSRELAKIGMPSTIQLICLNTETAYHQLKNEKKYSHVLFDTFKKLD